MGFALSVLSLTWRLASSSDIRHYPGMNLTVLNKQTGKLSRSLLKLRVNLGKKLFRRLKKVSGHFFYIRGKRTRLLIKVNKLNCLWRDAVSRKRFIEAFDLSSEIFYISYQKDPGYFEDNIEQWKEFFGCVEFRKFTGKLVSLVSDESKFCAAIFLVIKMKHGALLEKLLRQHQGAFTRKTYTRQIVENAWGIACFRPFSYYKSEDKSAIRERLSWEDVVDKRVLILCCGDVDAALFSKYLRNSNYIIYSLDSQKTRIYNLPAGGRRKVHSLLGFYNLEKNEDSLSSYAFTDDEGRLIDVMWKKVCELCSDCRAAYLKDIFDTFARDMFHNFYRELSCLERLLQDKDYDYLLLVDESGTYLKEMYPVLEANAKSRPWIIATSMENCSLLKTMIQESESVLNYLSRTFIATKLFSKNADYRMALLADEPMPDDWVARFNDQISEIAKQSMVSDVPDGEYIFLPLCFTSGKDKLGYDSLSLMKAAMEHAYIVVMPNLSSEKIKSREPPWIDEWTELASNSSCLLLEHDHPKLEKDLMGRLYLEVLRENKRSGLEPCYCGSMILSRLIYKVLFVWLTDVMPRYYLITDLYKKKLPRYIVGCFHRVYSVKLAFEIGREFGVKSISSIPLLAAPGDSRQALSTLSGDYYSMVDSSQRKAMIKAYSLSADRVIQGGGRRYDDARRIKTQPLNKGEKTLVDFCGTGTVISYFPQHSLGDTTRISMALLLSCCKDLPGMRFIVKPHPAESLEQENYYRQACSSREIRDRCICVDRSVSPLLIVDQSDVVCTHCSNVGIEAALRGKAVVTLHPQAERWIYDLADMNIAYAARSGQEILDTVHKVVEDQIFKDHIYSVTGQYLKENPQFTDNLTFGHRVVNFMESVVSRQG